MESHYFGDMQTYDRAEAIMDNIRNKDNNEKPVSHSESERE